MNRPSFRKNHSAFIRAVSASLLMLAGLGAAQADGGGRRLMPTPLKAYTQECGACHTAYPPGLLPARSWQRLMQGLQQHYGTDASLDAPMAAQIGVWLQANAGTDKRVREEPPQDRITRSAWFERKHRKLDAAVWSHTSVKTAANCAACHTNADIGRFDERDLRVPAGLEGRLRRGWSD